ncbi:MAG TPA: hypothetical protein VFW93_12575 [Aquabacterium sp.]|uniref:hypothetical protein n=1 Tax=Aquabacterium sp. TaxID=1872578 RepID=UPI002E2F079E|nr:hypothetical protein [Aquabacterium sp.]HEX5357050.1 hypothetical protein [Aquabacterium sp.]
MDISTRLALSFTMVLALLGSPAWAEDNTPDPDKCVVVTKEEKGSKCNNNPASLALTIQNQCGQPVDLKYAIERTDGKWSSGVAFNLQPRAINDAAWTCASTGQYRVFARTAGSSAPFPDDKGTFRTEGNTTYALAHGESPLSACARVKHWGSGRCECEQPQLGNPLYRCRARVSGAIAVPQEPLKPFPANQFTSAKTDAPPRGLTRQEVRVSGSTMEDACGAARAVFVTPESSCVCIPTSTQAICTMTGLLPEGSPASLSELINRKAKEYLKNKHRCGQPDQTECASKSDVSVSIGVRG